METIIIKPWSYSLYKEKENYILSVLCGTVGLYEIEFSLNDDEKIKYNNGGEGYIDSLALKIQSNPLLWKDRTIELI